MNIIVPLCESVSGEHMLTNQILKISKINNIFTFTLCTYQPQFHLQNKPCTFSNWFITESKTEHDPDHASELLVDYFATFEQFYGTNDH